MELDAASHHAKFPASDFKRLGALRAARSQTTAGRPTATCQQPLHLSPNAGNSFLGNPNPKPRHTETNTTQSLQSSQRWAPNLANTERKRARARAAEPGLQSLREESKRNKPSSHNMTQKHCIALRKHSLHCHMFSLTQELLQANALQSELLSKRCGSFYEAP